MPTTYNSDNTNIKLIDKINKFKKSLKIQFFILLVRPKDTVYKSETAKKKFILDLELIIEKGLLNLEIPWVDNENWLELMSELRCKFPHLQLGSASIINKKSIDDSIKLDLNFSMMRFWDKDLYIYSRKNDYFLIPGMTSIKDFKEAISYNCCTIKIFPVTRKDNLLDINEFNQISFLGAGDIAINDITKFKSLGYQGVVIGRNGYDGEKFDPNIYKTLKSTIQKYY